MSTADSINIHFVNGNPFVEPLPKYLKKAVFGLGCFWGAERCFWQTDGVFSTAVGYAGGQTLNPSYQEVCTGETGHAEVVLVIFDPGIIKYTDLLKIFWENHNPTQGNRQGNDIGTQYICTYCVGYRGRTLDKVGGIHKFLRRYDEPRRGSKQQ